MKIHPDVALPLKLYVDELKLLCHDAARIADGEYDLAGWANTPDRQTVHIAAERVRLRQDDLWRAIYKSVWTKPPQHIEFDDVEGGMLLRVFHNSEKPAPE